MALISSCPGTDAPRTAWKAVGLVLSILGALPAGADSFMNRSGSVSIDTHGKADECLTGQYAWLN
jgi:hypothetical protein